MEEQIQTSTPAKKSHKKSIVIILGLIILMVAVFAGGFFIFNNFNNNAPVTAQGEEVKDKPEITGEPTIKPSLEIKYKCEDNKSMDVAIYNEGESPSVNLVLSDGTSEILYPTVSASGARYANSDESVVFWTKGDEAYVEIDGKKIYTGCVSGS